MNVLFKDLSRPEESEINGGGVIGAVAGAVAGTYIGGIAGSIAIVNSARSGSSVEDSIKAGFTVMGVSIVTCTVVCGIATGLV